MVVEAQKLAPELRTAILTRTPDQVAEDAAIQAEAEHRLGHLVPNTVAGAHYKAAAGAFKAIANSKNPDLTRLADALFWMGRFRHASCVGESHPKYTEYERFADAFDRLNRGICSCAPIQMAGGGTAKGVSVPARRPIQRVFVGSLGKEVIFITCERCKQLFAETV